MFSTARNISLANFQTCSMRSAFWGQSRYSIDARGKHARLILFILGSNILHTCDFVVAWAWLCQFFVSHLKVDCCILSTGLLSRSDSQSADPAHFWRKTTGILGRFPLDDAFRYFWNRLIVVLWTHFVILDSSKHLVRIWLSHQIAPLVNFITENIVM